MEPAFKGLSVEPPKPIGESIALEFEPFGTLKTSPEHRVFLSPTGRQLRPPDLQVISVGLPPQVRKAAG